jgi:hypothetical protein
LLRKEGLSQVTRCLGQYNRFYDDVGRHMQFPDLYISSIESVESVEDLDLKRRKEKEVLIENIIKYR